MLEDLLSLSVLGRGVVLAPHLWTNHRSVLSIKMWTNQRPVFSIHLPLGCQQPLHTHWAPGVDTSSRDPDLGIEVVLPPLFVLFQIFLNPFEVSQCPEKASSRYNGQLHGFLLTEIPIVIYDLCGQVSPNTYLPLL